MTDVSPHIDTPRGKTGPKSTFTKDDVVAAALEIGIDRFTLGQVARQLGISTPALYRVVESRSALLNQCIQHIAAHWKFAPATEAWPTQLRFFAAETWRLCEEFPGLERAVITASDAYEEIDSVIATLSGRLFEGECPLPADTVAFAIDFIGDTVLMSHNGVTVLRSRGEDIHPVLDSLTRKIEFIIAGLENGLA